MKQSLDIPHNRSPTKLQKRIPRGLVAAALSAVALTTLSTHAVLLTSAYETQIEGWLGLGDVTLPFFS
jgi:hypothetical protein